MADADAEMLQSIVGAGVGLGIVRTVAHHCWARIPARWSRVCSCFGASRNDTVSDVITLDINRSINEYRYYIVNDLSLSSCP